MTVVDSEHYIALIEAGASPGKARSAAEAVASYDNRFTRLGQDNSGQFAKIEQRFVKVDGELTLLKWMVGFNLAGTVGILLKLIHG